MTVAQASHKRLDLNFDGCCQIDVSEVDTGVLWRVSAMAFRNRRRMEIAIVATLIVGGAITLLQIGVMPDLLSLSFVPVVGITAPIARLKLRDTWLALQDRALDADQGG